MNKDRNTQFVKKPTIVPSPLAEKGLGERWRYARPHPQTPPRWWGGGKWSITIATLMAVALLLASCQQLGKGRKTLTLAINSGVEGDALKQAARDYEAQTGCG